MLFPKRSIRFCGYTLIELMVTTLIVSILSMAAAPSLRNWVESSRAKSTRYQLYGLLNEARTIALLQSRTVTICKLEKNICTNDFDMPVTSFIDLNRNARLETNEQVIRYFDPELPEYIRLFWNRNGYLRFWPSGGTGSLTGSLSYCYRTISPNDFRLVIARTGRVRVDKGETRCSDS